MNHFPLEKMENREELFHHHRLPKNKTEAILKLDQISDCWSLPKGSTHFLFSPRLLPEFFFSFYIIGKTTTEESLKENACLSCN